MLKKFTVKVTNLESQNINAIPFDEFYRSCVASYQEQISAFKLALQENWKAQQELKVKHMAKLLSSSIESNEGLEESIKETLPDTAPVLGPETIRKVSLEVYKAECEKFADKYSLKARISWLPSQLMAYFGNSIKPVELIEDSSKYSPEATVTTFLGSANDWTKGAFIFVKFAKRGDWIDYQYKEPGSFYSSLVPFILGSLKKHKDISYNQWDRSTLSAIVEPQLCEAMLCAVPEGLDTEELLKIREVGMQIKSGKNAGGHRNPLTTYKLWGCQSSLVGDLPWLAQVMLTQIWCAHPEARNKYMVLDPRDWDSMPERLISTDIMTKELPESKYSKINTTAKSFDLEIPWLV